MAHSLKHYRDFKQVLVDYKLSDRARQALEGLRLVLMVAPTSTGRNTIISELLKTGDYYFIISDTTRPPQVRDGQLEENGVQYFFRSEEEVLADLRAGEFLEAAIIHEQQVSGISIRELEKAKNQDKIAITDIEVVGTDNLMQVKPDAVAIFLIPPSYDEWHRRIEARSQMSPAEVRNRLMGADKEFVAALKHDYYHFVIAGDLETTIKKVDQIAKGQTNAAENKHGRELVKQLHQQLQSELKSSL